MNHFLRRLNARHALAVLLAQSESQPRAVAPPRPSAAHPRSISEPLLFATIAAFLGSYLLSPVLFPTAPLLGYLFGRRFTSARSSQQAYQFAAELPPLLLATASLLKAGLSPQEALRRASDALPITSECRTELIALLERCDRTLPLAAAVAEFGTTVALPELEMFRSALVLSSLHGGRLSESLARLARVTSDRALLIRSATAATAQMRLTGSILLGVTPLFLGFSLIRDGTSIAQLASHPFTFTLASAGAVLILASYLTLLYMSDFKP